MERRGNPSLLGRIALSLGATVLSLLAVLLAWGVRDTIGESRGGSGEGAQRHPADGARTHEHRTQDFDVTVQVTHAGYRGRYVSRSPIPEVARVLPCVGGRAQA